ncbi:hypothetical protein EUX98_g2554 [Antrodiella citrinella]|uniref:Uncharacterized protein n=1 Tax=Antrodiella citrinella TaxID=2447956 RepID=A0A4V6S1X0_9APHY|nr:hypothetical protein EUX98_g2554 [Antrodiella citrinella]
MSSRTITFPRPPPTCNTLSSQERTKLLKTTAKLGSVLGSTPHVMDDAFDLPSPILTSIPARKARLRSWSFRSKKASSDTSDSESDTSPTPCTSSSSRASSSSTSSSASSSLDSSEASWRARLPEKRPPLLRLGMSKRLMKSARRSVISQPTLESIPGSPPPPPQAPSSSPYCDIIDLYSDYEKDDPFGTYANSSYVELSSTVPMPTFAIPSDASLRREKMRRLKRKLGEQIPVHLVFPPIAESDEEDVWIHSPTTPTLEESGHNRSSSEGSFDSSSALLTDSEREDVLPPLPNHLPLPRRTQHPSRLRHEAHHQSPRRSSFAHETGKKPLPPLPSIPPLPTTTRTVKRRSGQFIIHYECASEHGAEAFDGLRCVGGVDGRIGYAI